MESHRELEKAVTVQITVLTGRHLGGIRAEECQCSVRVEFNGCVLGDSEKLDVAVDRDVVYNFTCSFKCSEVAQTLDDLAHKPVILTVFKDLPKKKQQEEQKTAVLGQAVVDLLPLLKGQCSFSSSVLLHAVPGSHVDVSKCKDSEKPTLDVSVSVQEPLLSDVQICESNTLMVTVETAYCVPDIWDPTSTHPSSYVAALQVPLSSAKEQVLLFSNGKVKMGGERESVPRAKKWPVGPLLAPGAEVMEGEFIVTDPTDMSHGDLTDIEDSDFRADAEVNRKRVSWDTMHRCFIDAGGLACLFHQIAQCSLWPIEIMRCPHAKLTDAGKKKKEKQGEDEIQISFHGVVYMDLAPLLDPGVCRVHGAYRIYPFNESELLTKTQRTHSILKEQNPAPAAQDGSRPSSSVSTRKNSEIQREDKDALKKPSLQGRPKPGETDSLDDMKVQVNTEGQMYADSRSYIVIEIALENPLVPKKAPEESVMLDIPKPPQMSKAERAVQRYHSQIASVIDRVSDQYQQLFGAAFASAGTPLDPALREERKAKLHAELNTSGEYLAFKEQMKYSVVQIVREKMKRTEPFKDPKELQAFLSQLYVYLVDEMHVALNKALPN